MQLNEILKELSNFSNKVLIIQSDLKDKLINECEEQIGYRLPTDFKIFLKECNGIELLGTSIYGINDGTLSMEKIYKFEHFEVENPMPLYLIPFSPDGAGSHYCFDARFYNPNSCQIVFWQHDYLYTKDDTPEVVGDNFLKWVKDVVIDWTLENFDYEGNER